jgi:murein L,D-transpeptidase YcbB/YkuD
LAHDPLARPLREALSPGDPLAPFYAARGYRPLWITRGRVDPAARRVIAILEGAAADDLDPAPYNPAALAAAIARQTPDRQFQARTDIALSRAFAAFIGDLHRPARGARLAFVDPAVAMPSRDPSAILGQAARAPDLTAGLAAAQAMNPIYRGLRAALARGGPGAPLIAANLERARALPPSLGGRYILVDIPAQILIAYDHGARVGGMRVVVGALDNQTPAMIGLIRYALFNPYWNVPPDVVRQEIAPHVLRDGPAWLQRRHFEAVSEGPVDWDAVADGTVKLPVRQLPGRGNVMGKVKFMLPNPLGIYLHDTPQKRLFGAAWRADSHGCVRLQRAERLAHWLFGRAAVMDSAGPPDQRRDLAAPAPVYIVYLTAVPTAGGVVYSPDIYGRDPALTAELAGRPAMRR